jgi:hypothetical protein
MAKFTVEITGQTQDQFALELSIHLNSRQGNIQASTDYSERDLDPVNSTTIVSVVTSAPQGGLQVAESIWGGPWGGLKPEPLNIPQLEVFTNEVVYAPDRSNDSG